MMHLAPLGRVVDSRLRQRSTEAGVLLQGTVGNYSQMLGEDILVVGMMAVEVVSEYVVVVQVSLSGSAGDEGLRVQDVDHALFWGP